MKGTAILLLGAATLIANASALPYSKISDGALNSDGYHYKKSSSNSNSNSYSQSNNDEADISGSFGGQAFSGTKSTGYSTNGASHSQSSSFSSGNFNGKIPIGIIASGLPGLSQGSEAYGNYDQAGYGSGNPGTAGLGLGENGAGVSSVSFGTNSYGESERIPSSEGVTGSYGAPTSIHFGQDVGSRPLGAVQYWWNGANSPFGQNGRPFGGCGTTACTLSGSFDLTKGSGGAHSSNQGGQVGLNINGGNPFFNKGVGVSGSSGFAVAGESIGQRPSGFVSANRPIDASKNPFLNGGYSAGSGSFASSSSSGSGSSGYAGSNSGSFNAFTGAGNPFLKPGSGSSSQGTLQGVGFSSTVAPGYAIESQSSGFDGSLNPFFTSGSSSSEETLQGLGPSSTAAPEYAIGDQSTSFAGSLNPFLVSGSPSQGTLLGGGPSSTIAPDYVVVSQQPGFSGSSNPFLNSGFPSGPKFTEHSTLAPTIHTFSTPAPDFGQSQSTIGDDDSFSQTSGSFGSSRPIDGDHQIVQTPIFPSQAPSFPSSQTTIKFGSSSSSFPTQSTLFNVQEQQQSFDTEGTLTVDCNGVGKICVSKNLCVNGRVVGPGKDLLQVRTGPQLCKVDREVCCTLDAYSGSSSGSFSGSSSSFPGGSIEPTQSVGSFGSFGQSSGSEQTGSSSGSFGQTGQFGSSDSYDQSQQKESSNFGGQPIGQSGIDYTQRIPSGQTQGPGSFGVSFGQNSYDQSQQKESSNFDGQTTGQSGIDYTQRIPSSQTQGPGSFGVSFGQNSFDQSQQKESSNFDGQTTGQSTGNFDQQIPSGFSQKIPAPSSGNSFKKPFGGSFNSGASSSSASSIGSASSGASGQVAFGGPSSGVYISSSPAPTSRIPFTQVKQPSGGLFDNNSGEDLSNGFSNGVKGSSAANGYLPPVGSAPSGQVPSFSLPPKEGEDAGSSEIVTDFRVPTRKPPTFPPAPPVPVQVGCAAALICVEEHFCTLEGVISPQPVALTKQQLERRVPLSSCRNPDNGVIGKCCRDPNYVDPWPTGNLPANYTGGFDEQGFPSYLNYAKTHPPKKPTAPTKSRVSQPTKSFVTTQKPLEKGFTLPSFFPQPIQDLAATFEPPNFFNVFGPSSTPAPAKPEDLVPGTSSEVLGQQSDDTPSSVKPPSTTQGSFFGFTLPPAPSLPSFPPLPSFPTISFPFLPSNQPGVKTNIDASGSDQSPLTIEPHTPGVQCGLRNKVIRPSNLDQDVVAFGEIPWQAMILSTTERKLLCSGAIVAPNAVLTAAHCVIGLRPDEVSIKSGEWKLGYEIREEEPLPFEIVKVSNIVPHPGYHPNAPSHDLAILFLEHPVALDQHVDIICLGDIPQPTPGRKCISTGWGKTVLQVHQAGALMHSIDVDVVPQESCQQRIQGAESQIPIDNTLTCVKAHKQRNNMCQVDVGGPLACDRGDGFYELTGVYSRETGCLPTNQVATFALIDVNWVKNTLLAPPQLPRLSFEIDTPKGDYPSGSNIQTHFESQVTQPAPACDCQKSYLPPALNQYLPPK